MDTAEFVKRSVIFVALAVTPILIWRLSNAILVALGACLVATILSLGAEPFMRLKVPRALSLVLSGVLVAAAIGAAFYFFGTKLASELQDVFNRVEAAEQTISKMLHGSAVGHFILSHLGASDVSIPLLAGSFLTLGTQFFAALIVSVVAGFYLVAQPDLYRKGIVGLFPLNVRHRVDETIHHTANALRRWLLGELIQMVLIGLLSTMAVLIIGLPSPFALGLIAGLAEFVPYFGPIIASIPALLVATTANFHAILWTAFAYLCIHQLEGNLIAPIVQREMVYIPPVMLLFSVVIVTSLFGVPGVVFAAPIAVIVFVVINKLYVRDCLDQTTRLPGETGKSIDSSSL